MSKKVKKIRSLLDKTKNSERYDINIKNVMKFIEQINLLRY